jgi:hypothetical protein
MGRSGQLVGEISNDGKGRALRNAPYFGKIIKDTDQGEAEDSNKRGPLIKEWDEEPGEVERFSF